MKLNRVNEFKLILPAIHDNVSIAINTLDRFLCVNNIVAEQASEIKLVITEALDNAMVSAVQNGLGVNEACNIKLAEMAYRANAYMFKTAAEISTFMLEV